MLWTAPPRRHAVDATWYLPPARLTVPAARRWVSTITPDVHAVTTPYLKLMAKTMLGDEYINSVRAEVESRLAKKRSASSAGVLSENTPAKRITEGSC